MKNYPGFPVCPKCSRKFTIGDLYDATPSSDLSYLECEYDCADCGTKGNIYFDFASITKYEED